MNRVFNRLKQVVNLDNDNNSSKVELECNQNNGIGVRITCIQKDTIDDIQSTQQKQGKILVRIQNTIKKLKEVVTGYTIQPDIYLKNQDVIIKSIDMFNDRLNELFKILESQELRLKDGDKLFTKIESYMELKEYMNGNAEKQVIKTEQDIKEINEKREPILDQLNTLKNTKAEKGEVNDVLLVVTDMQSVACLGRKNPWGDGHCGFCGQRSAGENL